MKKTLFNQQLLCYNSSIIEIRRVPVHATCNNNGNV